MNYKEFMNKLSKISPDEHETEARILIESFTNHKISYLKQNPETELSEPLLEEALMKREKRIPLQYIVGKWDFYRQTYFVDENCLIPRQDTEILVEKAIELLPRGAYFADLCTGSGCIAVSILAEREDTSAIMVDKFSATLSLARKNAAHNGVTGRVEPVLFDVLADEDSLSGKQFDAIISNPPYIRPEVIETLSDEVKHEPYAALDGGEDGLIFYRKIVKDYGKFLNENGFFLFEIGYDQAEDLRRIADDNSFNCEIFRDYGGNDRVAYLKRK